MNINNKEILQHELSSKGLLKVKRTIVGQDGISSIKKGAVINGLTVVSCNEEDNGCVLRIYPFYGNPSSAMDAEFEDFRFEEWFKPDEEDLNELPTDIALSNNYWDALRQTGAKKIIVKEGIKRIPDHAFELIKAEEVVLPKSLIEIAYAAFEKASIKKIVIPEGVTEIGEKAFYQCKSLEDVTFPNSLEFIGSSAFQQCEKLTSIVIPHVTMLGSSVFHRCSSLKSAKIMSGLKEMGTLMFANCSNLKEVHLCNGISLLEESSFSSTSIEEIHLPDSIKVIGSNAFNRCTKLKKVTLPKELKYIPKGLFSSCYNLESITIPETVESIGQGAFYECQMLTEITCPPLVNTVYKLAFYHCNALKKAIFMGDVTMEGQVFSDNASLTEIHISAKSLLNAYDTGNIKDTLNKLVIDDFVIEGISIYKLGIEQSDFYGTALEPFADTLVAIKYTADDTSAFLRAFVSYLSMVKEAV